MNNSVIKFVAIIVVLVLTSTVAKADLWTRANVGKTPVMVCNTTSRVAGEGYTVISESRIDLMFAPRAVNHEGIAKVYVCINNTTKAFNAIYDNKGIILYSDASAMIFKALKKECKVSIMCNDINVVLNGEEFKSTFKAGIVNKVSTSEDAVMSKELESYLMNSYKTTNL